jgi:hypothetical protein
MPRTLFVHVGPRKTGTSAIQNCLRHHDNSVVIYPKVGLHGPGSHHKLVYRYFGEDSRYGNVFAKRDVDSFYRRISRETMDSDLNIVISSEALEDESRDAGEFINALLPHLSQTPLQVELLVGCREHFGRAASWYNHRIRALRGADQRSLPDEFLAAHAEEICYAPLIRRLRKTGYPVTALNYHPSSTWTERFFGYLGFQPDQIPRSEMKNVSIGTNVLIAKIAANQVVSSKEDRLRFMSAFDEMPEYRKPSGYIFGREAAAQADAMFAADRKFLADEYGLQLNPPDIASQENVFYLDPDEFNDIAKIAADFGEEGEEIVGFARQFLRESPRSKTQPAAGESRAAEGQNSSRL